MKFVRPIAASLALLAAAPLAAQEAAPVPPAATAPRTPPKLIVVISVDQFSADLFAEYRNHFTGGFARLLTGAVFPAGYQSHAATETCPGHSTITTGDHPARTGIIANDWTDMKVSRGADGDHTVYCAEDETVPGSTADNYTVSDKHLRVPTLGERMKAMDPATRVVSVAGKDRAAVMMGGHNVDELWWWNGKSFVSYAGRTQPEMVMKINAATTMRIAQAQPAMDLPATCVPHSRAIPVGTKGKTVGDGRFARAAGDAAHFRASPEFDEAILALAAGLISDMKLGQGSATDIITIGASATDYVGHGYGTEGSEMCLQLLTLDQNLGKLFGVLDSTGVDYQVVLTADHGGHDLPERNRERAMPMAQRVDALLAPAQVGPQIATKLGLKGQLLWGGTNGDVWIDDKLTKTQHDKVLAEAVKYYSAAPQVAAVLTRAQVQATPMPTGPAETWTLLERARASFDAERSGDFLIALKPRVTAIPDGGGSGSVATHGSFWDYDRRVPMLFWRKGMTGFEQPLAVETIDIAPTLAALIGLKLAPGEVDGRCLDLDAGVGDSCQ